MRQLWIGRLAACFGLLVCFAAIIAFAPVASAQSYTIDVESGGLGTVSPSGSVVVPAGGSQTFTFAPSGCFVVGEVTVDDVLVGTALTQYTFTNVQSDHVLYVPFGARPTTTALEIRPITGQCAVPETLTATVSNSDGGQVRFFNDGTLLGTRTLVSGTASFTLPAGLPTGTYAISVTYDGSTCAAGSSSPDISYTVSDTGPTPVKVALALSGYNVPLHTTVSLTAKLLIGSSAIPAPQSGHVTFYDGASALGTVVMSSGFALQGYAMNTPGVHVITAVATLNMCASTVSSAPETLIVQDRIPTSIALTVIPTSVDSGGYVLMRAVLSPNMGGTIHFLDVTSGSVEVGTASTGGGVATLVYGPILPPNRVLRARFDGNADYQPCLSNQVLLPVIVPLPPPPPPLFTPPYGSYDIGGVPGNLVAGDLNADGWLDLVTACPGTGMLALLRGNGDGTFWYRELIDAGGAEAVANGDMNGDGRPDLVVATNGVSVMLGNGDCTFGPVNTFNVGTRASSVAIGDLNSDGRADVVTANYSSNNLSIMLGNGDGTLGTPTHYATGSFPQWSALGDLNGDGRLDIVTVDGDPLVPGEHGTLNPSGELSTRLGNGDGTFGSASYLPTGLIPRTVSIADLNSDGRPDVVTPNSGAATSSSAISVLMGVGNGVLAPQTLYGSSLYSRSVAIADLDGDGRPDLTSAGSSLCVLKGRGDGTFEPSTNFIDDNLTSVVVGDFNGDGRPDVATASEGARTVIVLLNTGDAPVATLLAQFDAITIGDAIELRWSFGDPSRVVSAIVERAPAAAGPWTALALESRQDGDITAAIDRTADAGQTHWYRLNVKLVDGTHTTFGPISSTSRAFAVETALNFLSPNPTPRGSQIQYSVAHAGHVRLDVADVQGRMVATLFEGPLQAGRYRATWDGASQGTRLPAGLYFVRLTTSDRSVSRKLTRLE